ncbi:MAG TPA: extracellular solute-binding protein [Chloroflexota bacterium]|nr:extracellular solute-binding protein [Chloroflexota bacterium]
MANRYTRRSALRFAAFGFGSTLLAACGGPPPAATPTVAPAKPAEAPTAAAQSAPTGAPAAATAVSATGGAAPTAAKPAEPTKPAAGGAPAPAPTATALPPVAMKPGLPVIQFFTGLTGPDGEVMRGIVARHNEQNAKFQTNIEIMPWTDMFAKLIATLTAGQSVDVAIMHPADIPQFLDSGAVLPVMDYLEPLGVKTTDYIPTVLKWSQFNGKQMALPLDQHQWNIWLRTDLAEKAGLDLKEMPKDGKTFLDWATKLTKKNGDAFDQAGFVPGYPNPKAPLWSAVHSNGGQWYSDDGKKCTINTPESVEAFQWVVDLYGKVASQSNDALTDFVTGKAAMFMSGPWNIPGLEKQQGIKYDVFETPAFFKKTVVPASGHTLTLPKNPDKNRIQMGAEFIKWVSDHSDQWAPAGHIPAKQSIIESEYFKKLPYRKVFQDSIKDTLMWTNIKTYNEFTSPTGAERANIELIVTKKIGVKEGLAKMEKESNEALARAG